MATEQSPPAERGGIGTRLFALGALVSFIAGLAYGGREIYYAATDAFVAPIILSLDNDLVLASKVKVAELEVERDKTRAEAEEVDADLEACETAILRLDGIKGVVEKSMQWTKKVSAQKASFGTDDLKALDDQKAALTKMADKQHQLVHDARANLEARLVSTSDFAKEVQAMRQLKLALLENDRTRIQSRAQLQQAQLAERSLAYSRGTPMMPELILRDDQLVRIELERIKAEAEARTKRVEKKLVAKKLQKLDEVAAELLGRPLFRAIAKSLDVGFVPYTQLEGVSVGAPVLKCVWGLFRCRAVGTVAEVVKGEVILPDPWGNQARGQYAILNLWDHEAAKSKTLRVRSQLTPATAARATGLPSEADAVR